MSPEQAGGMSGQIGPASDVYSLGATLYHLLSGRPPFEGSDVTTVLQKVRSGAFLSPRAVMPAVPRLLEAICLRAMALKPEDRYTDARDLAVDLQKWLADEPISAFPEGWVRRLARWGRRHRPLVRAAATALVLVTAVSVAAAVAVYQAKQIANHERDAALGERNAANKARDEAEAQRSLADRRRREAEATSAIIALNRGLDLATKGDLSAALVWMARALELAPADRPDLERLARTNLGAWRPRMSLLDNWIELPKASHAATSPDGRTVVTGHDDGTVRLWDAATGSPRGRPAQHRVLNPLMGYFADETDLAAGIFRVRIGDDETTVWLSGTQGINPEISHDLLII